MGSTTSIIKNLYYTSPYSALPPGIGTTGITLQTDPDQSPTPPGVTNPVLVIRLRMASSGFVIGISATSGPGTSATTAIYQPAFPLSAMESYMIDVIWVPSGTPPENIDWNAAVTSAPVTAAEVLVENAAFDGTALSAQLAYGGSGIGIGAQVNVYSLSGGVYVNIGKAQTQGNMISVPVNGSGYPEVYFISAQAATPTTNQGGTGSFSPPFSLGPPTPISSYTGIPQTAKTVSSAVYNGNNLALSWVLDTIEGCVAPDSSLIQILEDGEIIASFKGGPVSASIPVDVYEQENITVQLSTVANNISSVPLSLNLITQAPVVSDVVADKTSGKVTASVTTVPSGPSVEAYLMDGDKQLAGPVSAVDGVVSFDYSTSDYNVEGMIGLSIIANATASDGKVAGPLSSPSVLLATPPVLKKARIRTNPSNTDQWSIDIEWERLPDAAENITSYTAAIIQDSVSVGTQTTSGTVTTINVAKSDIDLEKEQSLQLYATGITGGASPQQSWSVVFTPPLLTSLITTDNQIGATWTAPTIPSTNTLPVTYRLILTAGDAIIYSGEETTATRSAIPLSGISIPTTGDLVVLVNIALGPVTLQTDKEMATACSATPILTAPAINAVTASPVTNLSTLNWAEIPDASSYNIYFTQGSPQENVETNSFTLDDPLTPGSKLGYTVQGNGTSNGVPVTGPPSLLSFIPTNTGNVSKVRFDGSNVYVDWEPVSDALCYNISVYDNASTPNQIYSEITTRTSASFSITTTADKEYTACIQPVMENGTGLCGATSSLFSSGIFVSRQPASVAYPYVYPALSMSSLGSTTASPAPQVITLYLPELGAAAGALGSTPISVTPFTIEPSGDDALPYKLTIAADDMVWIFDTAGIRASLQSAYVDFLKDIETPPAGELPGATPYGISLVQSAIASIMPQTFFEQLYYNFGFSTISTVGTGYVDLRPGMVLRVLASDYISIAQGQLPSWINGYAGVAAMDFEIGSYTANSNWRVGFDAFLNTLSSQGSLTVSSPATSTGSVQAGLAGAVDLYYPQFVQPFYRLYFPTTISSPWGIGSNLTESNFTIAAATNYSDLQDTTVNPTINQTAYFRGRTVVEVMIKIMVNGNERLVPIGTSLGNVLEQLGLKPEATSPVLKQIRVNRSVVAAITNTGTAESLGPQLELRVDWDGLASYSMGNGLNAMSVPLLPGDQITTNI